MTDLYAEALATFASLFAEAKASQEIDATAMTVATADIDGRPSARTVLLKAFDERGFVFYTHLDSRKGRELHENRQVALLFLWRSCARPASRCGWKVMPSWYRPPKPMPISPHGRV